MPTLIELNKKYQSSKGDLILSAYDDAFFALQDKEIKILEIGVQKGKSLMLFRDYFNKATIVGVDIKDAPECWNDNGDLIEKDRIEIFKGDSTDYDFMEKNIFDKYGQFDIIIDDGSHVHKDQNLNVFQLWRWVVPGGIYIIEDLCTSYWKNWEIEGAISMTEFLKSLIDELNYVFWQNGRNYEDYSYQKPKNEFEQWLEALVIRTNVSFLYKKFRG
jgi:SAM-dependent methyltransferase